MKRMTMTDTPHLRRMKFRAWHRGTRESDYTVGGFFDRYHATWNEEEIAWFERFMEEQDADIMGWAMGTIPAALRGRVLDQGDEMEQALASHWPIEYL